MTKEALTIGGRLMTAQEATVRAGPAGGLGVPPLVYGHGPDGVGQIVGPRMQTRGTSLWGIMAAPAPMAAMPPAQVEQLARHLVDAAKVIAKHRVLELSFGHVPLNIFDGPGQAAVQAALGHGAACNVNGFFLFYLGLEKPVNKSVPAGQILRASVAGNETRFCGNGRSNAASSISIVSTTQNHGSYVANVCIGQDPMPPARPAGPKLMMNARDEQAIRLKSKMDITAATFTEAAAPVYTHIENYEPGLVFTKRGREEIHDFLEGEYKKRRHQTVAYEIPRRDWQLAFWHRRLLHALVSMSPEKRRLFWIKSTPDAGKGTFGEYLGDHDGWIPDLFPNIVAPYPGVLNVTSYFTDGEKLAQMYSNAHVGVVPPGILIVDFGKDTDEFTKPQLKGMELLANVGEPLNGARYGGHSRQLKSHAVVFSNASPPAGLLDRCVWLLDVQAIDHEPDWTWPFKPRDHAQQASDRVAASALRPLPEAALAPGLGPALVAAPAAVAAGYGCVLM